MTVLLQRDEQLGEAITRAQDFLLAAQDANGAWRDFLLPAGLSDNWVTAWVGETLAGDRAERSQRAARRGWAFLQTNEAATGGWSYNPHVPGDADSTLWGLRLAERLGEGGSPVAGRAADFLETHLRPDLGLATYADAAAIRRYTGLPAFVSFHGWIQSHACVSAAGANLAAYADRIAPYLLAQQEADGGWPAYFWFDREYTTGEAVVALAAMVQTPPVRAAIERAAAWLTDRVTVLAVARGKVRPAFALACAVNALALVARTREAVGAVALAGQSLAVWQRPTGSWGPSARLRVPAPFVMVPRQDAAWTRWEGLPDKTLSPAERMKATFSNFSPDHRGLFGAAAALRALRRIAGRSA